MVLPPPEGPTSAVTSPCFAVKDTSLSTVSPYCCRQSPHGQRSMSQPLIGQFLGCRSAPGSPEFRSSGPILVRVAMTAARFCSAPCRGSYSRDDHQQEQKDSVSTSIAARESAAQSPASATVAMPSFSTMRGGYHKDGVGRAPLKWSAFSTARIFSARPSR